MMSIWSNIFASKPAPNPGRDLAKLGHEQRKAKVIAKAVQLRKECGLPVPAVWL